MGGRLGEERGARGVRFGARKKKGARKKMAVGGIFLFREGLVYFLR